MRPKYNGWESLNIRHDGTFPIPFSMETCLDSVRSLWRISSARNAPRREFMDAFGERSRKLRLIKQPDKSWKLCTAKETRLTNQLCKIPYVNTQVSRPNSCQPNFLTQGGQIFFNWPNKSTEFLGSIDQNFVQSTKKLVSRRESTEWVSRCIAGSFHDTETGKFIFSSRSILSYFMKTRRLLRYINDAERVIRFFAFLRVLFRSRNLALPRN